MLESLRTIQADAFDAAKVALEKSEELKEGSEERQREVNNYIQLMKLGESAAANYEEYCAKANAVETDSDDKIAMHKKDLQWQMITLGITTATGILTLIIKQAFFKQTTGVLLSYEKMDNFTSAEGKDLGKQTWNMLRSKD